MRWLPALLALAAPATAGGCDAAGPAAPTPVTRPIHVMSVNQCTDQLLLALLPPARIVSVSALSHDTPGLPLADAATRVGSNRGSAEEVLAQRPDLVVAGAFTTPMLRSMLHRLRYPLVEIEEPTDLAGIRRATRQVAAAVGEPARGEALIAAMDARFAALARTPPAPVRVVAWDRTGFSAGAGTLYDTIVSAAGARNLVRTPAGAIYPRPDVETLLAADPALLVEGTFGNEGASVGDAALAHPLVRRRWAGHTVRVPQGSYACGTPLIAAAAQRLRDELVAAR